MKSILPLTALCTAILPQMARAQVDVPPDGLRVSPTVRLLYDTNMLRQNDDLVTGDTDDLRITPTVDLTFRRQIGMHLLTVVGSAGYDFHQRYKFLDRERVTLLADGDLSVTGYCHARPRVRLNLAQANLEDQGVIVGNTQRTQDYRLRVDCDRPYGFYPVATVGYLKTTNSADARRKFNISTVLGAVGIGYSKESLGDVELNFSYERFRRPHVDEAIPTLRDGAENYAAGILFRRAVAPRLSWQVNANYIRTKPRADGLPSYSGLGYGAQANWRPSPRFSLLLDVDRSSRNQSSSGATYIIQTDVGLRANLKAGARSTITAGASWSHRNYKGELMLDPGEARDRDTTRAVTAGYRYTLRDRLQAGLELRHERRSTPVESYRYHYSSAMLFVGLDL
ncbi:outer membrane beta-barrel protein [Sphingobium bisphenolivorans]|uniref:outer membrane beta-barrel protein n=1 Tax=Sphingobium bisphenolivorans TaxID=1335760 RepID=UPI0003A0C235|nr:outer membrane beta-barrel protein [Sphingobium bisphenolivorans]